MNYKKLSKLADSLNKGTHKISDAEISEEALIEYLSEDVFSKLNSGKFVSFFDADRPGEGFIISKAELAEAALDDMGREPETCSNAENLSVEHEAESIEELLEIIKQQTSGEYFLLHYDWNDTGDVYYCGYISAGYLESYIFNKLYVPYGWYAFLLSIGLGLNDLQFTSLCDDFFYINALKDSSLFDKINSEYGDTIEKINYSDFKYFDENL